MKKSNHYVDNAEFTRAVTEYAEEIKRAKSEDRETPQVPKYVAECFVAISEGIASRPNFSGYTYRDEMVWDAVESCLKAVPNFDPSVPTKSGNPNAFGLFSKIVWWAFLRRIAKEKKQQSIKMKYIADASVDLLTLVSPDASPAETTAVVNYINTLKSRVDQMKAKDTDE